MQPTSPPRLILASGSPYRREALARLGVEFMSLAADIEESPLPGEAPRDLALRLARDKAAAVARLRPGDWVLGADQVCACSGRPLGKPGGAAEALAQLAFLRGRQAVWHSAVALTGPGLEESAVIDTTAVFRDFSDAEAARYVEADRPFDCAGAMRSESRGITLLDTLSSDDPTALMGLPLIRVGHWLRRLGFEVP